jgi:hypothetical protein
MARLWFVAATAALCVCANASRADAQTAHRAFVSGHGTDAAGCGATTTPCRSLQYVLNNIVVPGGEIDILDPAGYGSILIDESVSIINDSAGVAGIQGSAGSMAVDVEGSSSDTILLKGLTITAVGTDKGGINFGRGAALTIDDCVVAGFVGAPFHAIYISPNGFDQFGGANFAIINTLVANNGDTGIFIQNGTGQGWSNFAVSGVLRHDTLENDGNGVIVNGENSLGPVAVTITDTVMDFNQDNGLFVESSSGKGQTTVFVRNSVMTNGANGLQVTGPLSIVRVSQSAIVGNNAGWFTSGGGTVLSYGDNEMNANTIDNTAPPTLPHQ